jgi:hypothetical protein
LPRLAARTLRAPRGVDERRQLRGTHMPNPPVPLVSMPSRFPESGIRDPAGWVTSSHEILRIQTSGYPTDPGQACGVHTSLSDPKCMPPLKRSCGGDDATAPSGPASRPSTSSSLALSWPSPSRTFRSGEQQPGGRQGSTSTGWPARRRHHSRGVNDHTIRPYRGNCLG